MAATESEARNFRIEPALLFALVEQESDWDPWAWNPEPQYVYLWDVAAARASIYR